MLASDVRSSCCSVDVGVRRRGADPVGGGLALVQVAHREHDVGAFAGQDGSGFVAEAGVRSGDRRRRGRIGRARRRRSTWSWHSMRFQTSTEEMNVVEPAHPPSRKAPLVWAIGAAIPWLLLVVAPGGVVRPGRTVRVAACARGRRHCARHRGVRRAWCRCGGTACTGGTSSPQAVYTRSGWLVQERRIAPISRVQTVDTYRGPAGPAVRAGQRDGDDGVVGGRGADRGPGRRRRRPGGRAADRHRGDRRRGRHMTEALEQDWHRLSPRMLLVHPVHEVLRQMPVLIGSLVLGSATGNPMWTLAGSRVDRRVRRGAVVHHQVPHRGRRGAAAHRGAAAQGVFGAAQQDSFGVHRRAAAAPAARA